MMSDTIHRSEKESCEKLIAGGLVDVASELRLVDLHHLVSLVENGEEASIADLVNSSTEMFFARGTLQYALSAQCTLLWDEPPVVKLDMEFRHENVSAYFRLTLGRNRAGVELTHLFVYGGDARDAREARLARALRGAAIRA
jgi:hypothetical protein